MERIRFARGGVAGFVHPFAELYRAVLKEKYPGIEANIPAGALPELNDIPEDVLAEALDRYSEGEELFIRPCNKAPADTKIKRGGHGPTRAAGQ
jgi:hypothetical protein